MCFRRIYTYTCTHKGCNRPVSQIKECWERCGAFYHAVQALKFRTFDPIEEKCAKQDERRIKTIQECRACRIAIQMEEKLPHIAEMMATPIKREGGVSGDLGDSGGLPTPPASGSRWEVKREDTPSTQEGGDNTNVEKRSESPSPKIKIEQD